MPWWEGQGSQGTWSPQWVHHKFYKVVASFTYNDRGAAACAVDAYLTHIVHALGHTMQTFLCVRWHYACAHVPIMQPLHRER